MERKKLYVLKCVGVTTIQISCPYCGAVVFKNVGHPARCPVCKALIKFPEDDIE